MEKLQERVDSKSGGGKMKGKVGVITGCGPPTSIGVCLSFTQSILWLTPDPHRQGHGPGRRQSLVPP